VSLNLAHPVGMRMGVGANVTHPNDPSHNADINEIRR